MDIRKQIEAILFSAGRKIELEEIVKLLDADEKLVKKELKNLKKDYDDRQSPTVILEEGASWKMAVREEYLRTVRKITPYMEFSKSLMETLAVVAWKQPILQSDVIKVRTNKAYEHIVELEKMGFLAKERHGRSFLLKLSPKFYDYFSLRDDVDVRNLFKHIKDEEPVQKKVDEFETVGPDESAKDIEVEDEIEGVTNRAAPENKTPEIEENADSRKT